MASITISVQSLLDSARFDTYTIDDGITVLVFKENINYTTSVDQDWYDLVFNNTILNDANTLASYSITNGSTLYSANIIATLATKQDRQIAKLNLASLNRIASNYANTTYDITLLPSQYIGNDPIPNPHPDGLILGRPWTSIAPGTYIVTEDVIDITTEGGDLLVA